MSTRIKGKISRKSGTVKYEAHIPEALAQWIEENYDYDSVSGLVTALFLHQKGEINLNKNKSFDVEAYMKEKES